MMKLPAPTLDRESINKELKLGWRNMRPFMMWGLFLTGPLVVFWMLGHLIHKAWKSLKPGAIPDSSIRSISNNGVLTLAQYKTKTAACEQTNFFLSPYFSWTILLFFLSGIPAAFAYLIYQHLGIDALLGYPSLEPGFNFVFILTCLYITGLSWCMMTLFFRAYFTFPLNFASTEYNIEVDSEGVCKRNVGGWMAELYWWAWGDFIPRNYKWKDIISVEYMESGWARLRPLPETLFPKSSIIYKALDGMAGFLDAFIDRLGRSEFIVIKSKADARMEFPLGLLTIPGTGIRLWELDQQQKAALFYAFRKYAPELALSAQVQQNLIGATVMRDARYTEIWFDMLMNRHVHRDDELQPGEVLAKRGLRIVEKIHCGGQALVYLAETDAGRPVVLKEFVLADGDGIDALAESAADFENESTILSQLKHDGIVELLDLFVESNRVYLVLEKIEGSTLRDLVVERGPLPESEVVSLAMEMCELLTYLHEQSPPVVHRDFTPDNLILTQSGKLKLIDFSVALSGKRESGDECVGKHAYTPPEQFRCQAVPQSDIYALGCTMYFLLTGADPVPISCSHVRNKNAAVSQTLDRIISRATALEPQERTTTASWLKLELLGYLAEQKPTLSQTDEPVPSEPVIRG